MIPGQPASWPHYSSRKSPGGSGCWAPASHADGHFSSLVVGISVVPTTTSRDQGLVPVWRRGQGTSGDAQVWPRLRTVDADNATNHILPGTLGLPVSQAPCGTRVKAWILTKPQRKFSGPLWAVGPLHQPTFFILKAAPNPLWLHFTAVGKEISSTISQSPFARARLARLPTDSPLPRALPFSGLNHSLPSTLQRKKEFKVPPSKPCTPPLTPAASGLSHSVLPSLPASPC